MLGTFLASPSPSQQHPPCLFLLQTLPLILLNLPTHSFLPLSLMLTCERKTTHGYVSAYSCKAGAHLKTQFSGFNLKLMSYIELTQLNVFMRQILTMLLRPVLRSQSPASASQVLAGKRHYVHPQVKF